MDPNETIRPWLLACSKQYGVKEAHLFRWKDADTRPREAYFTYQPVRGVKDQATHETETTNTSYTVDHKVVKLHKQFFRVDLYRSQDGMAELEAICLAATSISIIKAIFELEAVSFLESGDVEEVTTFDEAEIYYHQYVICSFSEWVEFEIAEINGVVETIVQAPLGTEPAYDITDDGYELS
jgi:hypothetical protein